MSNVWKLQFDNVIILGEGLIMDESFVSLKRPIIGIQTDQGIEITCCLVGIEDEPLFIYDIPGPYFIQQVSISDNIYDTYKELTSPIHLARAMPGKEN